MLAEEVINNFPGDKRKITIVLRDCIMKTAPMLHEKLSYRIPYFLQKSRICFVCPAFIPNDRFKKE